MREAAKIYHNDVLSMHNAIMFDTLIYPHNLTTETAKQFIFENEEGLELAEPLTGYFATKDIDSKKTKYFIKDTFYSQLPIRVQELETLLYRDSSRSKSIVFRPLKVIPFRINPEKCFEDNHTFIDELAPFEHSRPEMWTLNKVMAIMGYVGKTFMGICSKSEFGKSSIYSILDSITKKSPVFQPRSIPGILTQFTGDGNMVFDEVHESNADVKRCMENVSLQVAGNAPVYINGARKSTGMKQRYDVSGQSITFLYNVWSNYNNPEKEFFDNIFSNNVAIDSRFLKIKLDGVLTEKFDKNFDIVKTAEENKMVYIKIAKHLLYLQKLKLSNSYVRRYTHNNDLNLKGRKKIIYEEITWLLDLYCNTQKEYDDYINLFNSCITSYKEMVGKVDKEEIVEVEDMVDPKEKILNFIKSKEKGASVEEIKEVYYEPTKILNLLKLEGQIFEPRRGVFIELK